MVKYRLTGTNHYLFRDRDFYLSWEMIVALFSGQFKILSAVRIVSEHNRTLYELSVEICKDLNTPQI